ncbi:hypothetical protein SDC9_84928 [bioreactor metagenome]|uniref:Uncharacterized protein n=1 Tax=bioreactor metagenome TaxID=1076179 RepID=A0A644ZC36_9ZZZZ
MREERHRQRAEQQNHHGHAHPARFIGSIQRALGLEAAARILERGVEPARHIQRLRRARGQQRQHLGRIHLQRAAHAGSQRAHEHVVGKLVIAPGLQRLDLADRHLQRHGQRGDMDARGFPRMAQDLASGHARVGVLGWDVLLHCGSHAQLLTH